MITPFYGRKVLALSRSNEAMAHPDLNALKDALLPVAKRMLRGSPPDDGHPAVTLPLKDNPIVRQYSEDLHVCYLVDKGQTYEYIQNRHLEEDVFRICKRNFNDGQSRLRRIDDVGCKIPLPPEHGLAKARRASIDA